MNALLPTYTANGLTLLTQFNNPYPWQNPVNALDVDGDTFVSPIDAVQVINYLNGSGPDALPTGGGRQPPFLDVNGDGFAGDPSPKTEPGDVRESSRPVGPERILYEEARHGILRQMRTEEKQPQEFRRQ